MKVKLLLFINFTTIVHPLNLNNYAPWKLCIYDDLMYFFFIILNF